MAWVGQNVTSGHFLVSMLRQLVHKTRSQGANDMTARVSLGLDFEYLSRFIAPADLWARCESLRRLSPNWLNQDDLLRLELVVSRLYPDGSLKK